MKNKKENNFFLNTQGRTFPVVRPWRPKQNKVVVWGETDRKPLLTEAKLLVSLRTALAELPLPSVQVISLRQVLAQHVAAADGVASFRGFVHPLPELIEVSAGLVEDRRYSSCFLTLRRPNAPETLRPSTALISLRRGVQTYHHFPSDPLTLDCDPQPLVVFALSAQTHWEESKEGQEAKVMAYMWRTNWHVSVNQLGFSSVHTCINKDRNQWNESRLATHHPHRYQPSRSRTPLVSLDT